MNRREFLAAMSAGAVVTASGLWFPGQKLISIPSTKIVRFPVSWIITKEEISDSYYAEICNRQVRALAHSMMQTKEVIGANIL